MITILLNGGLGNQMFQYAFGRALACRRHEELTLDISGYNMIAPGDTMRSYALAKYSISAKLINNSAYNRRSSWWYRLSQKIGIFLHIDYHMRFHQTLMRSRVDVYEGFFQSYKYFADCQDVIRADFQLREPLNGLAKEFAERINEGSACSIHIRRGDYVTNITCYQGYGLCSVEYYQEAVRLVMAKDSRVVFYVFSDDIAWAKDNLSLPQNTVYVSEYKFAEIVEMQLMSLCQYNIIANSTFSWWGAWLNNNIDKIVVAPQKWANVKFDSSDLLPADWLKI